METEVSVLLPAALNGHTARVVVQGDPKVYVHLMITVQKALKIF
jgi:hypothetical protein